MKGMIAGGCVGLLGVLLCSPALAGVSQGRIVVGHDANTLSTSLAGANELILARNIAGWVGQGGTRLLMIEATASHPRHDYAPLIETGLADAGYAVTVTSQTNWTLAQLQNFDAIFLGAQFDGSYALPSDVILDQYVQQGGGLYLFSGMGPDAIAEGSALNAFVSKYGLAFDVNPGPGLGGHNGVYGHSVTGSHPIFFNLMGRQIQSANGQSIVDIGTNPNAHIVQTTDGKGLYGAIVVPAPGAMALMGLGGILVARRKR